MEEPQRTDALMKTTVLTGAEEEVQLLVGGQRSGSDKNTTQEQTESETGTFRGHRVVEVDQVKKMRAEEEVKNMISVCTRQPM